MNHSEFGHYRRDLRFSVTVVHVHPGGVSESGRVRRRAEWGTREPEAGGNRWHPAGGGGRRAGRVLVVGEDPEIRRLIATSLTLEGFDVATAVDGQDCLDKVLAVAPDVITLDALMPRLDGYQTAARLRKRPDTAHISVVLITPIPPQERDPGHSLDAGIDAYLVKPFDPAEMIRVVRRLASTRRLPLRPTGPLRAPAPSIPRHPPVAVASRGSFGPHGRKGSGNRRLFLRVVPIFRDSTFWVPDISDKS